MKSSPIFRCRSTYSHLKTLRQKPLCKPLRASATLMARYNSGLEALFNAEHWNLGHTKVRNHPFRQANRGKIISHEEFSVIIVRQMLWPVTYYSQGLVLFSGLLVSFEKGLPSAIGVTLRQKLFDQVNKLLPATEILSGKGSPFFTWTSMAQKPDATFADFADTFCASHDWFVQNGYKKVGDLQKLQISRWVPWNSANLVKYLQFAKDFKESFEEDLKAS